MKMPLLVTALVLTGCASVNTAMQYEPTVFRVAMPDGNYRIFEHPERDRVMTTPSLDRAASQGVVQGASFGLVNIQTPEQLHEAAAREHLNRTGRENCQIVRGYLLAPPQYEFFFECPTD